MSCVFDIRTIKAAVYTVIVWVMISFPLKGYSQSPGLEKFLKDKEATARTRETEITEFARSNKIPRSFNTEHTTHW
jgi:hypothetical protein